MHPESPRRDTPPNPAPGADLRRGRAGFTQAELQAAARVIANEVRRVNARYAGERATAAPSDARSAADPMRKSPRLSP